MPFEKGHKHGKGRVKGSTNKKTEQWNKFAEWFMSEGMERLQEEMSKLEGKDFVKEVKDLMEYFQPKLSRQEIKAEVENKNEIDLSKYKTEDLKKSLESN